MIYTGYYAQTKKYTDAGLTTIAISGSIPSFYKGIYAKEFAPRYGVFQQWKQGLIDDMQYTELYKSYLNTLDTDKIRRYFNTMKDLDVVLLCYERPGQFCHRHILADWLENDIKVGRVDEYKIN